MTAAAMHRTSGDRRTLVVHTGGIGDFLLFCPSLLRLREEGPVTLAGFRDRLNLAVVTGIAEDALDLDDTGFESVFSEPNAILQRFLARFDRAVVWMNDDGAIARAFEACGVGDLRVFPGLPPEGWTRHASAYYAEQLGLGALPPFRLPIEASETPHDVLIHPGSGGKKKNWPMERFAEVAARLTQLGRNVAWIRGPAEESIRIPPGANLIETPSLVTLARDLAATRLYVGNDSGVTHLAAACGCRTVAVFGPTDPAVWAPRGEHVTVVHGDPWPGIGDVMDGMGDMDRMDSAG
ncbi:MAG: glycoside hydrolase [Candidatus Hydrogenedentota bacterium]